MKFYVTSIFILISFLYFGKTNGIIRGRVLSQNSKTALFGARIYVTNGEEQRISFSDTLGEFCFSNLTIGNYSLHVSLLGFKEFKIDSIEIIGNEDIDIILKLIPSPIFLSTVTIRNAHEKSINHNVSSRVISNDEFSRTAGAAGDPARLISSFAGVNPVDRNNDLVVRGNSPVGMVWRLEGIEIPNPNHFSSQGSSGGSISMFNSDIIATSTFYSSAFPAE